jgi:hypothetical protein
LSAGGPRLARVSNAASHTPILLHRVKRHEHRIPIAIPFGHVAPGRAGAQNPENSVDRSPFMEATEQLMRALAQIETLPATPALRREEIKLQLALMHALQHVKGSRIPWQQGRYPAEILCGLASPSSNSSHVTVIMSLALIDQCSGRWSERSMVCLSTLHGKPKVGRTVVLRRD